MSFSDTALIVVDAQESFRQRPYWSDADAPAFLSNLQALIDGVKARALPVVQIFHVEDDGAFSLASGYVMPELRQSMMNTLGLDTLEVGDEGVRAGRYVTRDIFITLAQDFTGRTGQVMGVEYSVTRRLSLRLSTSTRGDSAVDLLWRRRY